MVYVCVLEKRKMWGGREENIEKGRIKIYVWVKYTLVTIVLTFISFPHPPHPSYYRYASLQVKFVIGTDFN